MTDEIAKLVVAVDSTSAKTAATDLDRLTASAGRAQSSVGASFSKTVQASDAALNRWAAGLEKVRNLGGASAESTAQSFTRASRSIEGASGASLMSWNRALENIKGDSAKAAAAVIADQQRIAARTAQIAKAVADYRASQNVASPAMAGAQEAGNTVQHFIDLNHRIDDYRDAQARAYFESQKLAQGTTNVGTAAVKASANVKKQAEAVHGLNLTSGQAAREYAVLVNELQRGDFTRFQGSVITLGNRIGLMPKLFTATGAAVLGVVAVLGTFAAAAAAGAAESERYNKQMALTADFAQTSSGEIIQMARSMEDSVVTTGEAREALMAVAASGRFFRDEIKDVGRSVAEMSRLTGKSVDELVKEFIKIKEDPLRAVTEMDKAMHFLDTTTRDAIRTAQEHGDMERAAALALEAVERASSKASGAMVEDAGYIVQAWRGVVGWVSKAKDAMLDIGRVSTRESQLESARARLVAAQREYHKAHDFDLGPGNIKIADQEVIAAANAFKALNKEVGDIKALRDRTTAQERANQASKEASQRLHDESLQYDRKAQRESKLATAEHDYNLAKQAYAGDQQKLNELSKQYEGIVAGINHRFRDFKEGSSRMTDEQRAAKAATAAHAAELKSLDIDIAQHQATVEEAGLEERKLSETERWATQALAKMSTEYSHLTEAEKAEKKQLIENIVEVDRANRARQTHVQLLEMNARALEDVNKFGRERATSAARSLREIGMSQESVRREAALDQIRDKALNERIELEEKYRALNKMGSAEYIQGLQDINDAEEKLVAQEKGFWEQRTAAMADWKNGARAALGDYIDAAKDFAGQMNDITGRAMHGLEDSITNLITTGKGGFKELANSIMADLIRMAVRMEITSRIAAALQGSLSGSGSGSGGWGSTSANYFFDTMDSLESRNGNVFHHGNVIPHSFGGVVDRMTAFPMKNGKVGTMAEGDVPEAIMPLRRGPDGRLGVQAHGTPSQTVHNDNRATIHVTVRGNMDKKTGDQTAMEIERRQRRIQRSKR